MITLRNVTKVYPPNTLTLDNVSLEIQPQEFISIVGSSGTGKTTLVKILTAEERVTSGTVVIGGWDTTRLRSSQVPYLRRQIGVVYQDFKLLPKKTVFENVAFGLQVCGVSHDRVHRIVPQVLRIVGLQDKFDRYPVHLSGGEQQRVAIARSLVHGPKILVADEPTGNLDNQNSIEIIDLLLKINSIGTTVILVSHNLDLVNAIKRRVIVLGDHRILVDQVATKVTA